MDNEDVLFPCIYGIMVIMKCNFSMCFHIFLFICGFTLILTGLGYLVRDDSNMNARIMARQLHRARIDTLFLGASHIYRAINPAIIDERLQCNSFVAGTASQELDASYALLRETCGRNRLRKVFVDLDYWQSIKKEHAERNNFKSIYIVSDYLQNPVIKCRYLMHATAPEYWFNSFSPFGAYKDISFHPAKIKANIELKLREKYSDYDKVVNEDGDHMIKGYIPHCGVADVIVSKGVSKFKPEKITADWKQSVADIVSYCRAHDIEVSFFSVPITDCKLVDMGNYDEYIDFVTTFLSQYGCSYYDFNLARSEYLCLDDTDFYNDDHINKYGAEKFSKCFAGFIAADADESIFHASYAEKIKTQPERIYGYVMRDIKDGSACRIKPVSGKIKQKRILYDVSCKPDGGEWYCIAVETAEREITYPVGMKGVLKICVRLDGIECATLTKEFNTLSVVTEKN